MMYKYHLSDSTDLSDLSWMGIEEFEILNKFKDTYYPNMPLIYLAAASKEFMAYRLDCMSCPLREEYFKEFELYLIKEITKHENEQ